MAKTKMSRQLADDLRAPQEVAAYLKASLEEADGDAALVAKALGDIARAKTGVKPIKTRKGHKRALASIEQLMNAKRNSPEGDRLDLLVALVELYERRYSALRSGGATPSDPLGRHRGREII